MKVSVIVALAMTAASAAATQCHPKHVAYLMANVKRPAQLCQYWLRGNLDRVYSPLPNLDGQQLSLACDCYLEERGLKKHKIKHYPAPTTAACNMDYGDMLGDLFNSTRYFCEYYVNDQVRHYSPVSKLTPQMIFDGCECYNLISVGTTAPGSTSTTMPASSSTSMAATTTSTTMMTTTSSAPVTTGTGSSNGSSNSTTNVVFKRAEVAERMAQYLQEVAGEQ